MAGPRCRPPSIFLPPARPRRTPQGGHFASGPARGARGPFWGGRLRGEPGCPRRDGAGSNLREDGSAARAAEPPGEPRGADGQPGELGAVRRCLTTGAKMEFLTWLFPALVLLCTQQHRCIR